MNTLFDVTLTLDQRSLLTAIAQPWLDTGEWPRWVNVQHDFDLRDLDAAAIYDSLPRVGVEGPFAAEYGFTYHSRASAFGQRDRVRLTVAACLAATGLRMTVGEPFVQALRHMVDLYRNRSMADDEVPPLILRSGELEAALPHLKPWFIKVLPDLLSHEPSISTGGGAGIGDGSWEREVTRSVWQFRDVNSVEEYIEKTTEIVTANAAQLAPAPVEAEQPPTITPGRGPYVGLALLDDLEKAAQTSTQWQLHKLIALCQGLNDAYEAGNPYVCAAMIRAVLDHIPPVFGQPDFKQVAAQYSFTVRRTDKAHAQNLEAFRPIGDDVLHRPIGPRVPVITMDNIPAPLRLNAVLHELLLLL